MPGIDPGITCHTLDIHLGAVPVCQKSQRMAPGRREKINDKVERLLKVKFIKPITYPQWVLNMVSMPKKKGQI